MNVPENFLYTDQHEWVLVEDDIVTFGITDYAQSELGDIVFLELPQIGSKVTKGDSFGTIEAVKAVSDMFAPLSGDVVEINEVLSETPELINQSPYDKGWMIKVRISDESEQESLLTPEAYKGLMG